MLAKNKLGKIHKRGVSLIELVLSLVILGTVFAAFSVFYEHSFKSYNYLVYFQKLFDLEKKLYSTPAKHTVPIKIDNLGPIIFVEKSAGDVKFELKKLENQDQNYRAYFR